jgi:hypothetical protein
MSPCYPRHQSPLLRGELAEGRLTLCRWSRAADTCLSLPIWRTVYGHVLTRVLSSGKR